MRRYTNAITNVDSNTGVGRISRLIPAQAPSTSLPPTHRWLTLALRPKTAQPDHQLLLFNLVWLLTHRQSNPCKISSSTISGVVCNIERMDCLLCRLLCICCAFPTHFLTFYKTIQILDNFAI